MYSTGSNPVLFYFLLTIDHAYAKLALKLTQSGDTHVNTSHQEDQSGTPQVAVL